MQTLVSRLKKYACLVQHFIPTRQMRRSDSFMRCQRLDEEQAGVIGTMRRLLARLRRAAHVNVLPATLPFSLSQGLDPCRDFARIDFTHVDVPSHEVEDKIEPLKGE